MSVTCALQAAFSGTPTRPAPAMWYSGDVADTKFLQKRRDGWYVQIVVPRDLRRALGSHSLIRSLRTRDFTVAQRRRWQYVEEAHEEFDRLRRAGEANLPLSERPTLFRRPGGPRR